MNTRTLLAAVALLAAVSITGGRLDAQSSAPSGLTAVVNGTSVTLTWQPSSGTVLTYVLEVGSAPGLTNLLNVATGGASTTLGVSGVPFGTYFVRVRAFSPSTGLSAPSNEIVVVVAPCSLPAPGGVTSIVLRSNVSLAWPAVAGATSYQIEAGSGPLLADLVNADVGGVPGLQVAAPNGTYYVRVRATAPGCVVSAASADTVVRVGVIAGISFSGVGAHGSAFTTYTEGGFTVESSFGPWTVNRNFGRPAPFVYFVRGGDTTIPGELRVTAGGATFRFTSVDLYSSVTPIPFVITGIHNSTTVFTLNGTVPNTFGDFATVSAATGHLPIDTLLIRVENPATPSCPTCTGNPMGIDNIAVSF